MIIFVVIMNNIVHNKMDFTKAIVDDIIKYYILSIGRDVHHLIMCKSVNKILYKIVSDILSSCSFFKNFSTYECIHQSIGPILSGFRTLCLVSKDNDQLQTTYHYIVNASYECRYNYHLDQQHGGEYLRLICYDGTIFMLNCVNSNMTITIGSCMSCFYKLDKLNTQYIDIKIVSGTLESRYYQTPLNIK
jgi:hypothetical protein